jgi:hypothetical protein
VAIKFGAAIVLTLKNETACALLSSKLYMSSTDAIVSALENSNNHTLLHWIV